MKKLSEILHIKRIDRPDEWSMDEFSKKAENLEKRIKELESLLIILHNCGGLSLNERKWVEKALKNE
jgi:hypothetical protein